MQPARTALPHSPPPFVGLMRTRSQRRRSLRTVPEVGHIQEANDHKAQFPLTIARHHGYMRYRGIIYVGCVKLISFF